MADSIKLLWRRPSVMRPGKVPFTLLYHHVIYELINAQGISINSAVPPANHFKTSIGNHTSSRDPSTPTLDLSNQLRKSHGESKE